jgi:hypothetical protein
MQLGVLAGQQVVVHHLAQQGVAERVEVVVAPRDDVARHRLAQRGSNGRGRQTGGVSEQTLVEAAACRQHPQHLLRLLAQALDAHHQRVAQRRRKRAAAVEPGRQQLLGEERVALAPCPEPLDQPVIGRRAEDVGELLAKLSLVERSHLDPHRARAAFELREQRPKRVAAVELVGAVGRHHEHALGAERASEEGEERARGAVRPMDVLDREDQRLLATELVEHRQKRLEQAALGRVVALAVRLLEGGRGEPGEEGPELAPGGLGECSHHGVLFPCQGTESRYQRRVRKFTFAELYAIAADYSGRRVGRLRAPLELAEEARLADSRLTGYECHRGLPGRRVGQSALEFRELGPSPDDSCARHPGGHGPSMASEAAVLYPRRGGRGSWR